MEIVSTISSSIGLVSRLREISKNINEAEFKNLLADLSNTLADTKLEAVNLKEELIEEKRKNQKLKSKIEQLSKIKQEELKLAGDVYMENDDGPFCTTCWDKDSRKIRLKEEIADFQEITGLKYICPVCGTRHKG